MSGFDRYIFRTTFGAFLLIAISLTMVIWLTHALREIDLMTNQRQTVLVFVGITGLLIPMLLAIIALEESKIVVASPATLVTLGDLKQWPAILCLFGFVLIAALNYRKVPGGTVIGILAVTLIGLPLGLAKFSGVVSLPPSLAPTFLQLDFSRMFEQTFIIVVFTFLLVDIFDNAGTLIGGTTSGTLKSGAFGSASMPNGAAVAPR